MRPRPSFLHRLWTVAVLALALTACGGVGTGSPGVDTRVASELLALVNIARAEGRTCGARGTFAPTHPLALDARLVAAVDAHARDLAERGVLSHTGGDGSDPGERIARTGYVPATWGENAAAGYPDVESVMAGWLGSDGHCANLMNPAFEDFGGAAAERMWVQVFARPR
ncbi:MAG: CAP domain-containing protein [Trueperaceae bacterium]|nr:CAP domain-containing protein [Trueperaceae bacterium]